VRTALRHGARQVTCAYRRDEANMPGSKKEVKNAREEGALFEFNVQPVTLELDEKGRVNGVRFLRTELGAPDAGGRRRPTPIPGSEFVMPADAVIMAFGFHPHRMPWLEAAGVALDSQGRIKAGVESRYRYQTSQEKIFAGGDAVRGAGDPGLSGAENDAASLTTNPAPQRSMRASFYAVGSVCHSIFTSLKIKSSLRTGSYYAI